MSLAKTTQTAYENRIKKITDAHKCDIKDTATVIKIIEAMAIQPNTKKNYYIALHNAIKGTPEGDIYKQAFQQKNDEQRKLPAPVAPNITYSQIKTAGEKMMDNESIPIESRILAGLCSQIAPVRLDCCNLKVIDDDGKTAIQSGNYIIMRDEKTSALIIQDHKTAKSMIRYFGTPALSRLLTPKLYALVKEWKEDNDQNDMLLTCTPNALGKTITRLFKKYANLNISQNTIRHAFITEARKGDRPLAIVSAIAKEMGHSVGTNEMYRWENYSQPLNPEL